MLILNKAIVEGMYAIKTAASSNEAAVVLDYVVLTNELLYAINNFRWKLYKWNDKYIIDKSVHKIKLDIDYWTTSKHINNLIQESFSIPTTDSVLVACTTATGKEDIFDQIKDAVNVFYGSNKGYEAYYGIRNIYSKNYETFYYSINNEYLIHKKKG